MNPVTDHHAHNIAEAALYALRCGCFFPVPEPQADAPVDAWIQWGALRNLHNKIAELPPPTNRQNP